MQSLILYYLHQTTKESRKLQEELKGAKAPGVKQKAADTKKTNETNTRLHDASTDSFERGGAKCRTL
jgi:hypothetical protein